ncbi:hypothetical protein CMV_012836 [Castanea mollissima]|uniref:Uncharacterized protein n=1 Tax=Castanea mollissima TaxID=60419 RepID=A0A8J4R2V5_9ROSI|nr:hypothetical protein CMV_012836 [Castanea mollissima]
MSKSRFDEAGLFVNAEVVLPSTIGWRTQRYLVLFLLVLCDCDFVRGGDFRVAEKSKIRIPRKSKWYYTKNYRSRFHRCWSLLTASGLNTKNFDPTSSRPCEIFTLFSIWRALQVHQLMYWKILW